VQKAIAMVFEIIYEPIFLDCSHGFRPNRGCNTAMKRLQLLIGNASPYSWVIEGDIKKCFDSIPHKVILRLLGHTIDCPLTLNLVKHTLEAGYVVEGTNKVIKDSVGTPQGRISFADSLLPRGEGSILSPLLSNIVLHELDKFVMGPLSEKWNVGKKRRSNLEYRKLLYKAKANRDDPKLYRELLKTPSVNVMDPLFKRIYFVRYADDWVLLVCGSLLDCQLIKEEIRSKLKNVGLELSETKIKITHLRDDKTRFLGFDFFIRQNRDENNKPLSLITRGQFRRSTPRLIIHAPIKELLNRLVKHGFVRRNHKGDLFPISKRSLTVLSHQEILSVYNMKVRGILNYYMGVHNRMCLWAIVRFLKYSCAITLASKYKIRGRSMAAAFKEFGPNLACAVQRRISFQKKTFASSFADQETKSLGLADSLLPRLNKPSLLSRGEGSLERQTSFDVPENLRILPMNERYKYSRALNLDILLSNNWLASMTKSQFIKPVKNLLTTPSKRGSQLSSRKLSHLPPRLVLAKELSLAGGVGGVGRAARFVGVIKRWKSIISSQ
jgi:retron-type reverse transcriptase